MKRWLTVILGIFLLIFCTSVFSENFTKTDAAFVEKYANDWDQDDEFEEEHAKTMVKYLVDKYEILLKNESNKKIALEIMQHIEKARDNARDELKEENWNSAGDWAVIGMIWVKALDFKHKVANAEKYYKSLKKSK
jgi:hypothetical protein